jgi:hypothetical protein
MRIKEVITEAGVPGAFRKGLFNLTGLGGNDAVKTGVARDNFIKKFAAQYDAMANDDSGAFNPNDYLASVVKQNNWGPLTSQQQTALDAAVRTNDSKKISGVLYQIGIQNRGGSSIARQPTQQTSVVKSTTGKPDDLSSNTTAIMDKIEMMASQGNVDDLQAICRDALNVLNKVAPTHYAAFIKQLTTGKKPNLAPAATDKSGVARTPTGRAAVGVQDLPASVQQRIAQQQK